MNLQQTLYDRIIEWAMDVDPADCRREIAWRRRRFPNARPRELAKGMLNEYSLASLAEGTLTALATGPLLAVPAAMVDAAFIMRAAARLNGCIGLMANPDYFATDAWRADVTTIIGDKPVAEQTMRRTAINVVNRTVVQVVTKRSVARFVPIVGGVVGGVWNFWELNRLGKRIFSYHFDDTLPNHAWPDEALEDDASNRTVVIDMVPAFERELVTRVAPAEPAVEREMAIEPAPAVESTPVVEPEPVLASEPADEAEPVVETAAAAEPEPVLASEPADRAEPVVETAAVDEPIPVLSSEPADESEPVVETAAIAESARSVAEPGPSAESASTNEAVDEKEYLDPFSRLEDSDLAHADRHPATDLDEEFEVDLRVTQPSIPVVIGVDEIEIEVLPSQPAPEAGASAGVRPSPLRKPFANTGRQSPGSVQRSEPVDTGTGRVTSKRNASPKAKGK